MRRVLYLTGTRADYGLMRRTLAAIDGHDEMSLGLIVTGMHLDPRHGYTAQEIEADGFAIAGWVPVDLSGDDEAFMARAIGATIAGCCDVLEREKPDLVLLLGDRGEMLAGAIAAIHMNVPVVHLHGGERSGTVDESVRHAISKLAHFHLTATREAAERLTKMGERPDRIFPVGAPGLDGLAEEVTASRDELLREAGFAAHDQVALLVFHPVIQSAAEGAREITTIIRALRRRNYRMLALTPNSDLGSQAIRSVLEAEQTSADIRMFAHLPRDRFVSWMAAADVMIGNSSSGIIEAATFGTPVMNVGSRQRLRERNGNIIDTEADPDLLDEALAQVGSQGRRPSENIYGDGKSAHRIAALLASLPLDRFVLEKYCAY